MAFVEVADGGMDSCHSAVFSQNLHDSVQIRGVGFAGNGLTDEGGDISLISPPVGAEAHFCVPFSTMICFCYSQNTCIFFVWVYNNK